jgi:hypothetical protein
VQLLRTQIPKAQKDTDDLTVFFHFWNLRPYKRRKKMQVILTLSKQIAFDGNITIMRVSKDRDS